MRFHGFLAAIALALLADSSPSQAVPTQNSASWRKCYVDTEVLPMDCNCTSSSIVQTSCSSETVKVTANTPGPTGTVSVLSAAPQPPYAWSADIGPSECIQTVLPSLWCSWWQYEFLVCVSYQVEEGLFFDSVEVSVCILFLGKSFIVAPMPIISC